MTTPSTIHAGAVLVAARGVLIRGEPGAGKSSLLLSMIYGAEATLVADDRVALAAEDGHLVAAVPDALAGLLEVRGVGIVRQRHVSPAVIHLVVDLMPAEECPRLPDGAERRTIVEGISVPRIFVAVGAADGVARIRAALADLYG